MQHHEFIGQVQSRARLSSPDEAERAARAALATLAERLTPGAAGNLAAQLPPEIARDLQPQAARQPAGARAGGPRPRNTPEDDPERLSLDEFIGRIGDREGVDRPTAAHHARAVFDVLGHAVTQGALENVRAQLPPEYDPLFDAGSEGRMRTE